MKTKRSWSSEEIALAERGRAEGLSYNEISRRYLPRRSSDAVSNYFRSIGVRASPSVRPWTPEEDTVLASTLGKMTKRAIGKILGRSTHSIDRRIGILRLNYATRHVDVGDPLPILVPVAQIQAANDLGNAIEAYKAKRGLDTIPHEPVTTAFRDRHHFPKVYTETLGGVAVTA